MPALPIANPHGQTEELPAASTTFFKDATNLVNQRLIRGRTVFRFKKRPELSKCSEENLLLPPDLRPIYGYSCTPSTAGPMSMYCDKSAPFHSLNSASNNKNGFLGVNQHQLRHTRSHENLMANQHPSLIFDFSSPNNKLQPMHPSVLDVPNCFKVNDEIYSCTSPQARTRWIERVAHPLLIYPAGEQADLVTHTQDKINGRVPMHTRSKQTKKTPFCSD